MKKPGEAPLVAGQPGVLGPGWDEVAEAPGGDLLIEARRVGVAIGHECGVQRRGYRAGALANHDDAGRVGKRGGQVVKGGGAVDIALVLDGEAGGVLRGGVADVEVEHQLLRVRLAYPEAELRAVGALAVAVRGDPLPRLSAGRGRAGPRLRGRRRG